ncbi:family 1 glycosylhydrolase [Solwaraspora sp. WMMD1047]|uniref:glycoside hydrolase family 1 protein n=1 Tax=Solwaraspora sp. WMMD1047 TaxID=3016102 RepID=UPI002415A82A|nr:family 1 glycosylhydrolase [Solwaraspora sp. WMMD1047]MDG4832525.1 family 1 glycosylhydrolase [Solwaraspora sp. WMMD1047]
MRRFPDGFLFGVATSGHQTEGGNTSSDTWFLENVTPTVFTERSGRACDSWERWREDLDLVQAMGLDAFRFSLEWARIEPREGEFSAEALTHYAAVVDDCLRRGLAPVVTLNHLTSPHWFAKRAGWLNPAAPGLFARYCDRVMEHFGDRIAAAVTLNEPNLPQLLAWAGPPAAVLQLERATLQAAAVACSVPRYRVSNIMLPEEFDAMRDGMTAGHLAAREAIKARRSDLPVGLSIAIVDDRVAGDDPALRDRKRAELYDHWLRVARDDDFIGIQNYESAVYDGDGLLPPPPEATLHQLGSAIDPAALGGAVRYAHQVSRVPVFVTEHGIGTDDDTLRAGFIEPSLAGLLDAIEDGVPVLGYCHWTLLDNFEWTAGYTFHFGLHTVDRATFARTPKPSAASYAAIATSRTVPVSARSAARTG